MKSLPRPHLPTRIVLPRGRDPLPAPQQAEIRGLSRVHGYKSSSLATLVREGNLKEWEERVMGDLKTAANQERKHLSG